MVRRRTYTAPLAFQPPVFVMTGLRVTEVPFCEVPDD